LVTPEFHSTDFASERRLEDDCLALSMSGQTPRPTVGHGA
jgi:hypothetical protein